jgi:hypothetical protein
VSYFVLDASWVETGATGAVAAAPLLAVIGCARNSRSTEAHDIYEGILTSRFPLNDHLPLQSFPYSDC